MRPITEVYTDLFDADDRDCFCSPYDYRPLLESIGHEILVQVDEENYQGDSYLLFRREDGAYGFLEFGWGSCSGCDALQATQSVKEIEELRDRLVASISWHPDAAAALAHLNADKGDQWYGSEDPYEDFRDKARPVLGGAA